MKHDKTANIGRRHFLFSPSFHYTLQISANSGTCKLTINPIVGSIALVNSFWLENRQPFSFPQNVDSVATSPPASSIGLDSGMTFE